MSSSEGEVLVKDNPLAIKVRKTVWVVKESLLWFYMIADMPWGLCHLFLDFFSFFLCPIFVTSVTTFSSPFHLYSLHKFYYLYSKRFLLKKQVFYHKIKKKISNDWQKQIEGFYENKWKNERICKKIFKNLTIIGKILLVLFQKHQKQSKNSKC